MIICYIKIFISPNYASVNTLKVPHCGVLAYRPGRRLTDASTWTSGGEVEEVEDLDA